ncbi:MotE family protein [Metabacillus sp. FJAT-53654]|uniref:Magnesium transporter MgtE intracellular domain-containing protein n=1 Tax=Metabacillus rhizosphaerae TaxID=3117747 RepID=A0ABZ2MQ07_9BACI
MENKKQEYGKFQWFFFVILIPTIFTATLVLVILSVAGFDVLGKTKTLLAGVPVVEKLFNDDKQETTTDAEVAVKEATQQKDEKEKLEKTIQEQSSIIGALENDVTIKEKEIQNLNQEINSLESQIEDINNAKSENKSKDIAKLYDSMTSKKAAEIIPNLNEADAMLILTSLDDKQVADILTKMTVDDAVKYTNLLASTTE